MTSKATSRLMTTSFYICLLFVFFQCISSQPVLTNFLQAKMKNHDRDHAGDSMWIRRLSYVDSDQLNSDENDSTELPKILLANEADTHDRDDFSSPVRRANFWKRANFWRKRANFWRRDTVA